MHDQGEFLFADGPQPELHLAHPLDDLIQAIVAAWALPIGKSVRVTLRDPTLPELAGRLELVRAPDLPLNPNQPLSLRTTGVSFTSREIARWVLIE